MTTRDIDRFVSEIVFKDAGAAACVSGPASENRRSIRALERADFRHLRTAQVAGGERECLMLRTAIPDTAGRR
jgi:RimJ/RimL family protein N-acetyltransferase